MAEKIVCEDMVGPVRLSAKRMFVYICPVRAPEVMPLKAYNPYNFKRNLLAHVQYIEEVFVDKVIGIVHALEAILSKI